MEKFKEIWKKYKIFIIAFLVIALSIAVDQATKIYFEALSLRSNEPVSIRVIGDFIRFVFVPNKGAALGILKGQRMVFFLFTLIGVPAFCAILYFNRKNHIVGNIGVALMIGGALGNAIDRLINPRSAFFGGYVRDFLDMHFFICNVADICLCVGVALLAFSVLFLDKLPQNEKSRQETGAGEKNGRTAREGDKGDVSEEYFDSSVEITFENKSSVGFNGSGDDE